MRIKIGFFKKKENNIHARVNVLTCVCISHYEKKEKGGVFVYSTTSLTEASAAPTEEDPVMALKTWLAFLAVCASCS